MNFKNVILNSISTIRSCMVDCEDQEFRLRHNSCWIIMGYKWQVVTLLMKVRKPAQDLLVHYINIRG